MSNISRTLQKELDKIKKEIDVGYKPKPLNRGRVTRYRTETDWSTFPPNNVRYYDGPDVMGIVIKTAIAFVILAVIISCCGISSTLLTESTVGSEASATVPAQVATATATPDPYGTPVYETEFTPSW